jgi:phage FluMu protein Com
MKMRWRNYRCRHCGKVLKCRSDKKWVKSWCEKSDRYVHVTLVK